MLSKKIIEKKYDNYKKWASQYKTKGKIELSLNSVEIACHLAHDYYIKLSDDEIENLITEISQSTIKINAEQLSITEKFVLYDSIAIDNMALSQQYLLALMEWDVEFLYILNDESRLETSKKIISQIKKYNKAEIFTVSSNLTRIEKIVAISNKIREYSPCKAFLHMDISDVVGVAVWYSFNMITRYLIDHADHAFWIGTTCSDYVIEFRNLGINIAKTYRNIKEDKILLQPFYPIVSEDNNSDTDILTNEKIKIFSGGRYFKIYSEKGRFMQMITHILKENPNVEFYFAGNGDKKPLLKFIKKNHLEERWKVISYKKNLVSVLNSVDIYIGTFPTSGALMANYAAYCSKPILELNPNTGILIENLLPKLDNKIKITYENLREYYSEANKLIKDKSYREKKGSEMKKGILSSEEFNEELRKLININYTIYENNNQNIDVKKMCDYALETEKCYLHSYPRLMLNKVMLKKSFVMFLLYFIIYIRHHGILKILKKIFYKITIIHKGDSK